MKHIEQILPEELGSQIVDISTSQSLRESIIKDATQGTKTETTMNEELQAAVVGAVRKIGNHTKQLNISKNGTYPVRPDSGTLLKAVDVHVDASSSVLVDYVKNGGKFAKMKFDAIESLPIQWEDMVAGDDMSNFMAYSECSIETMQKALNLLRDGIEYNNYFDSVKVIGVGEEAYLKMPVGFHGKAYINDIFVSTEIPTYLTLDFSDLEYTGYLFTWGSVNRLKPINTSKLKEFIAGTTNFPIDAFDCDGLVMVPFKEGIHNQTTTLGGFINLGKGFLQDGTAAAHTMSFDQWMQNLSHDSLVNIFNGLYDLNLHTFTFTNQPTIQLGATNYSRVSAAEIKIATDKGWIVTK